MMEEEHDLSNENAELIQRRMRPMPAATWPAMLKFVDPDLERTYLDPAPEHPTPQLCHGRHELGVVLRDWAEHGLRAEGDEVTADGELVMIGVRTPGSMPTGAVAGWPRLQRGHGA